MSAPRRPTTKPPPVAPFTLGKAPKKVSMGKPSLGLGAKASKAKVRGRAGLKVKGPASGY